LGEAVFIKLIAAFGGQSIKVPMRARGRVFDRLSEAIGREAAIKLIGMAMGDTLYIAQCLSFSRARRRADMLQMRDAGATLQQVRQAFPIPSRLMSVRGVRAMLNVPPQRAAAGDLFKGEQ